MVVENAFIYFARSQIHVQSLELKLDKIVAFVLFFARLNKEN